MSEKTLITGIKWLACAALCVPLVFTVYMYPSSAAPQTFLFRALVEAMLALYLVLVMKNSAYAPKVSILFWAVTAYMGVYMLAAVFGVNPVRSFFSTFDRHWGVITIVHFYLFFLILASVLKEKRPWQWLFGVSVGASVLVSLYGVYQLLFQNVGRIYSTVGNPAFLSSYLLLNACIAWWCSGDTTLPRFVRLAFLVSAYGIAAVALLTGTRAALLALIAGGIVAFAGYFFWRERGGMKTMQRFFLLITITVALGAGALLVLQRGDLAQKMGLDRLVHISISDVTAQTRLFAWRAAVDGVHAAPIVGVGPENFNVVFNRYFNADFYTYEIGETQFDRAHNIFVEALATTGVVGLLAYLGMFAALVYVVHAQRREGAVSARTAAFVAAFIAAYCVQGFFSMDVLTSFLPLFLVFAYFSGDLRKDDISRKPASIIGFSDGIAIGAILCAAIFVCWFINVRPALADLALSDADAATKTMQETASEEARAAAYADYQKALGYGGYGQETVRSLFVQFTIDAYQIFGGGATDMQGKMLPAALAEAQENVRQNPNDYIYYADLARVYNIAYLATKHADAHIETMIADAQALAPQRLEVPFALAQRDLVQGNYDGAIARANDGIARNKRFVDFYHIAFLAYSLKGDEENAFRALDAGVHSGLAIQSKKEMLWLAEQHDKRGMSEEAQEWREKAAQQ